LAGTLAGLCELPLTTSVAHAISQTVAVAVRVSESTELAERVTKLEQQADTARSRG